MTLNGQEGKAITDHSNFNSMVKFAQISACFT